MDDAACSPDDIDRFPDPPEKAETSLCFQNSRLELRRSLRSIPGAIAMTAWVAIWSVAFIYMLRDFTRNPTIALGLFLLPFLAVWLFGACVWIYYVAGFEQLTVDDSQLVSLWGAGPVAWRTLVPINEVRGLSECVVRDSEDNSSRIGLEILTSAKPVRFAMGVSVSERIWLGAVLGRVLGAASGRPPMKLRARAYPDEVAGA